MKKILFLFLIFISVISCAPCDEENETLAIPSSSIMYFPPLTGNLWESKTISNRIGVISIRSA